MQVNIEKELYKLIKKAYKKGEVPVAAVLVRKNQIIAKAYNKRKKTFNPLFHAEVQTILKAAKKIGDWRLDDCELYVTLEPCHMCMEIIKECRVRKVFYYLPKEKEIDYKIDANLIVNDYSVKYKELLTTFFHKLR